MSQKVKSFMYLASFIIAALVYYNVESKISSTEKTTPDLVKTEFGTNDSETALLSDME